MKNMVSRSSSICSLKRTYYLLVFLDQFALTLPVYLLFGHDYLGLSYFTFVLVFTVPSMFIGALAQVPGGAWADRHGRRRAFLIGTFALALWWIPFACTKNVWIFALVFPLATVGAALKGGSLDAILSAAADRDPRVTMRGFASNRQSITFASRVLASAIGGALYEWQPRAPIVGMITVTVVALLVGLRLPETPHAERAVGSVWASMREAVGRLHRQPGTWSMLLLYAGYVVASELVWVGYQPTFSQRGVSPALLGIAFTVFSLVSAIGSQLGKRLMAHIDVLTMLRMLIVGVAASAVLIRVLPGMWALAGVLPIQLGFGMGGPLITTFLAARSIGRLRATTLSFQDLVYGASVTASAIISSNMLDAFEPWTLSAVSLAVGALVLVASINRPLHLRADGQMPRELLSPVPVEHW